MSLNWTRAEAFSDRGVADVNGFRHLADGVVLWPSNNRLSAGRQPREPSGSAADEGMQRISWDDRAAADADYRQAAGGDVAVDGSSPKARRLTGLIDAVSKLRGMKLIVPHVLVPIVHRRPYAHRVGQPLMGQALPSLRPESNLVSTLRLICGKLLCQQR
jgi:hypothetical protein